MSAPERNYGAPWPEPDAELDALVARRFGSRRGQGYRCPACLQMWFHARALRRHMAILHHRCRFCTKAYIMVDHHEKRSHTIEWALVAGACEKRP